MIDSGFPVGVILCGGRSRRMGQDKNFMVWQGQSFLQSVVSAVEPCCRRILLVTSTSDQVLPPLSSRHRIDVACDQDPYAGPVASLKTALEWLAPPTTVSSSGKRAPDRLPDQPAVPSVPAVFLTGADSPALQPGLITYLLDRLNHQPDRQAVVPRFSQANLPATRRSLAQPSGNPPPAAVDVFPLCAVYATTCLPPLRDYYQRGGRSMHGFLACLNVDWVSQAEFESRDPHHSSLLNINTPADYRSIAAGGDQGTDELLDFGQNQLPRRRR